MAEEEKNNEIVRLDLTDSPRTIVKYKTGEDSDQLFGHIKNYPAVRSDIMMFIMANALQNKQKQIVFSPAQLKSFIGYRQSSSLKGFREAIHTIFRDLSTVGYETEEIDKDNHHHTVFRSFFQRQISIQPLTPLQFNWVKGLHKFLIIFHVVRSLIALVFYNIFKSIPNIVKISSAYSKKKEFMVIEVF